MAVAPISGLFAQVCEAGQNLVNGRGMSFPAERSEGKGTQSRVSVAPQASLRDIIFALDSLPLRRLRGSGRE
jgi:hypothetical protein